MSQFWNPNKRQRVAYEDQTDSDSRSVYGRAHDDQNEYGIQGTFSGFSGAGIAETEATCRMPCAATQSQDQSSELFISDIQGSVQNVLAPEETVCFGMVRHALHRTSSHKHAQLTMLALRLPT
jgi:hypothetical protein